MARLLRMTLEVHPPTEMRPHYCLETFEQVRTARPNRILHYAIPAPPDADDIDWVKETISAQLESLLIRVMTIAPKLEF